MERKKIAMKTEGLNVRKKMSVDSKRP